MVERHRSPTLLLSVTTLGGGTGVVADEVLAARRAADLRGCGAGLAGPLLPACLDRGIDPMGDAAAADLVRNGVRVRCATLGTSGGARTDADGRVLDTAGRPIAGLFAAGNIMAAPTAMVYGGGTVGPIVAFARRAGRAAARS